MVGDPPYGVRAGGRKIVPRDIEIRDRATHIIGTSEWHAVRLPQPFHLFTQRRNPQGQPSASKRNAACTLAVRPC